ncbi:hypothetical protein NHF46_00540 [Arthrobacter alpinus]|nr:hypothetical protein [Arthrobacter alpinus]
MIFEDWDNQYDGAAKHTAFYQHTLGQYVKYFAGKQAAFAHVQGPQRPPHPTPVRWSWPHWGLPSPEPGTPQHHHCGVGMVDAVVDYLDPNFVGLRTEDAMYRFFDRNAFGAVMGMTIHLFADGADADTAGDAWGAWFNGLYAQPIRTSRNSA